MDAVESVNWIVCMGGDLRETGGTVPSKYEVGRRPMHTRTSPNISRSSVIGCVAKYELTKKMSWGNVKVLK